MLEFFLTIIAGIIALSLVSSLILGVKALNKKRKENEAYLDRVNKAMTELREKTDNPNL